MIQKHFHIAVFSLLICVFSISGQTRKQLEAQRKKLNLEMKQVNNLLFKEIKKEKNALDDLKDINKKIDVRTKLIATINSEATVLTKEISRNESKIHKLDKKLADLKKDYSDMILKSYKSKSQQSKMMFLLSSKNFYQAYKRLEYMKQYTKFRKKQGEEIEVQTDIIKKLNDSLLYQKRVKDTLIITEKQQREEIETDKKKQEQLISKIKSRENKYKKELQKKVREEKRITAKIDKLIKAEIEKANRIAREKLKAKSKTVKKNEFLLSPEAKALANKFELNKGKLPWPVDEGIVARRFGKQPHPTFPGITINGTGLHIVTRKGKQAQAIFNGTVLNVLVNSQGRKNVLIQHGNYISSYNNLENTSVKKGDSIKTGQTLGQIFTDKVSKKTKLIFVLFKNTTRLNPSFWIKRR